MRKLLPFLFFFSFILNTQALSCTDLKVTLKRGSESKDVLALQQFLAEKKLLTATPNGYFGFGTEKAVKTFQKSKGFLQSGIVGQASREAIRKETCGSTTTPTANQSKATTTQTVKEFVVTKTGPAPVVTSLDKGTVILGGETEWGVVVKGSNFSTTTNIVTLVKRDYSKRYTLGTFPSDDKKTIKLPKSLGTLTFPCELQCRGLLQEGEYFVMVTTREGGESALNEYIVVKDATIVTGSVSSVAIPYVATGTRIATFSFKVNTPLSISSIVFNLDQGKGTTTVISDTILKDERSGAILSSGGSGVEVYQGEYKHVALYGNVESTKAIKAVTSFTVLLLDKVSNNKVTRLTSASTTVSFEGEPASITEAKRLASIAPPKLTAVDRYTVLAQGDTTWGITVTGYNFSTTTNTVYLKARVGGRKYKIGTFASTKNRTTLTLPKSLGNTLFSCGNGCTEKLMVGDYDLTVETSFGESEPFLLTVSSFNFSARSGSEYEAIQPRVTSAKLGTFTFGTNTALKISAVKFNFSLYKNTSTISGTTLKDDLTGQALVNAGKDTQLVPGGSMTIGAYASVTTTSATGGTGYFSIDVIEPIGGKITTFTTQKFEVNLSSY